MSRFGRLRVRLWIIALAVLAASVFGVAVAFAEEPAAPEDPSAGAPEGEAAPEAVASFAFECDDPDGLIFDDEAEVRFNVRFENLVVGENYTLSSTLITPDGAPFAIEGAPVAPATETFQAEAPSATLAMRMPLDPAALPESCDLGVTLELSRGDEVVLTYDSTAPDGGEPDTLTVRRTRVSIAFNPSDADGAEGMLVASRSSSISVAITAACPSARTYTLRAELIDLANGQTLVAGGMAQTHEETLTDADLPALPFTFDALALGGTRIGARASLLDGDRLVAEATTTPEEALTIVAPTFHSTLADAVDGDDTLTIDPEMELIDTITYDHLDPSKDYSIVSLLMDAAKLRPLVVGNAEAPDETEIAEFFVGLIEAYGLRQMAMAEPAAEGETPTTLTTPAPINREALDELLEDNGALITSLGLRETELKPSSSAGALHVTLAFNGARFGADGLPVAVTTCTLLTDGESVLAAELTGEEGRVVTLAPAALSGALAPADASLTSLSSADDPAELVNTVGFEELVPERDYTLKTVLIDRDAGEDVLIDGEPVEATVTFTPSESSGTQPMTIELTPETLAGTTLGVREELYRDETLVARGGDGEEGVPVVEAAESDGEEEPAPGKGDAGSTFAKTGFAALPWAIGACAAGGGAAALAGWRLQRKRRRW